MKMNPIIGLFLAVCSTVGQHKTTDAASFQTMPRQRTRHSPSLIPVLQIQHYNHIRRKSSSSTLSGHLFRNSIRNYNASQRKSQLEDNQEVEKLRDEIEQMKKAALQKLDLLEKASISSSTPPMLNENISRKIEEGNDLRDIETYYNGFMEPNDDIVTDNLFSNEAEEAGADGFVQKIAVSNSATATSSRAIQVNELNLLDNTPWKVSMNIGREPGTW